MGTSLEDVRVLREVEGLADQVWTEVTRWDGFARDVVGGQLARAADSIGANIAESFGRFHYGEKLQFLFFARGSLFETKYWLNRAMKRNLITSDLSERLQRQLELVARQLNAFIASLKAQRRGEAKYEGKVREAVEEYRVDAEDETTLFDKQDISSSSVPNL